MRAGDLDGLPSDAIIKTRSIPLNARIQPCVPDGGAAAPALETAWLDRAEGGAHEDTISLTYQP